MGLYEVPLCMSLLCFRDGDYVSQLSYVWYYVVVKSRLRNASPRGLVCFRCMMFSFP